MRFRGWLASLFSLGAMGTGLLHYYKGDQIGLPVHLTAGMIGVMASGLLQFLDAQRMAALGVHASGAEANHLARVQRICFLGWVLPLCTLALGIAVWKLGVPHPLHLIFGLCTAATHLVSGYELWALEVNLKRVRAMTEQP